MHPKCWKVKTEICEAELLRMAATRGNRLADGAEWVFKLSKGEVMAFYSMPLSGPYSDLRVSLKLVTYYLCYPYAETPDYQASRLVGRFIKLIIERRVLDGREVPVIDGFAFSPKQLFAYGVNDDRGRTGRAWSASPSKLCHLPFQNHGANPNAD